MSRPLNSMLTPTCDRAAIEPGMTASEWELLARGLEKSLHAAQRDLKLAKKRRVVARVQAVVSVVACMRIALGILLMGSIYKHGLIESALSRRPWIAAVQRAWQSAVREREAVEFGEAWQ